jgi:hypothetical protein
MELIDLNPDLHVPEAEYVRLLGYPPGWVLDGRSQELADWARQWYAMHGQPWTYACRADAVEIEQEHVMIDGEQFASKHLSRSWRDAGAHTVVLAAVSAGAELELEANRLWRQEKPDEYFFLEVLGSAIVEHLMTGVGARICAWADRVRMAALPHYSPGYRQWDVAEQPRLLELIRRRAGRSLPGALAALSSGMLQPKKSQLAVFGVTRHVERVERSVDLVPCASCTYAPCQYRRSPYVRAGNRYGEVPLVANGGRERYDRDVPALPTPLTPRNSDTAGVT